MPTPSAAPHLSGGISDDDCRMLADELPALAWVADADGYIYWYNRRWHDYCGTDAAEMEGWGWQSVHDPSMLPAVLQRWQACILSGSPFEMTFPLRAADGSFRPFLTRIQPVHGAPEPAHPHGRIIRWVGTNIDMSAEAEALAALRAERDRSQGILNSMAEGFMLLDHAFRILDVNAEALRIDRRTAAELLGRIYWEVFAGAAEDELKQLYTRAMREHVPVMLEHCRRQPNGGAQWIESRAYPSAAGKSLAIFYRDVTERRRAQDDLRESEARLRLAQRTGRIGTFEWLIPQDHVIWSPELESLYGLAAGTFEGNFDDWRRRVVPADAHAIERGLKQAMKARQAEYSFEFRILLPDGTRRWLSGQSLFLYDEQGLPLRMIGVNADIHERKQAEAALREFNAVLEQRVALAIAERESAEEKLRQSQKMEAVGQLTGGLAHDFNNLLTGIGGSLELLGKRLSQGRFEDLERYLAAAQESARRAAALTHRLLAFSRRQTLDPRATDAGRLVSGMEDLIRRTMGPAISVRVVLAQDCWSTLVDPPQLENALLNLCINARDAMPDGGSLSIEISNEELDQPRAAALDLAPGQYVRLCVEDSGAGMPPEVIARAFDPFYTTKPLGAGTGLGLSMVYGFARQSGGQARIASTLGQGAIVCLFVPRHRVAPICETPAETQALMQPAGTGRTVLVVDDEPSVRMLVSEIVEELGFTPVEAEDGASALKILRSTLCLDLLISDVGLPGGMNGRQVADAGRLLRPGLKVLFITGYAETAVLGEGALEPGMHVATKPFAMAQLAARISAIVDAG